MRFSRYVCVFSLMLGSCETKSGPAGFLAAPDVSTDTGTSCDKQFDCTLAQVCAAGKCGPIFPRKYTVTLEKASVSGYDSSGKGWDENCVSSTDTTPPCPPDPVARMLVDGKVVCETSVTMDSYEAAWNKVCTVDLSAKSEISFQVVDRDGSKDSDDKLQKDLTGADLASDLRNSQGKYLDSYFSLWVTFAAQ